MDADLTFAPMPRSWREARRWRGGLALAAGALMVAATAGAERDPKAADAVPAPAAAKTAPLIEVEKFDLGGLPSKPTSFLEQRLAQLIASHKAGDIPDAIAIQEKLAEAYRARHDSARAEAAEKLAQAARAAQWQAPETAAKPAPSPASAEAARSPAAGEAAKKRTSAPAPAAKKPPFTGIYWCQHPNGSVEKWDFHEDGTFLHHWISGARTSERGEFAVEKDELVLKVGNVATAFAASTGYKQTTLGGSNEASGEVRRLKLKLKGRQGEEGIIIDGVTFAVRHWN